MREAVKAGGEARSRASMPSELAEAMVRHRQRLLRPTGALARELRRAALTGSQIDAGLLANRSKEASTAGPAGARRRLRRVTRAIALLADCRRLCHRGRAHGGRMSPGLLGPRCVRRVLSAVQHHARQRSRAEWVRPTGLYLCAEAHSAVRAGTHAWPESKSTGAAGAPDSRHRGAHERSVEGAKQPQIQQQRCEHPQAVEKAEVRCGVTPGQGRGHAKHHQPPEVVGNSLPQLEVFHHAHAADRTAAVVWSASCPPRATSQVADEASREPDWRAARAHGLRRHPLRGGLEPGP